MSEVKVNKISPRTACGTVTLGDSGDTFTIPSGATINNQGTAVNFGATGSASWVTTVKTSTFTAVAGEGYFVNTTGGAVTVNLPAGTAGAVVAIKDYAGTFDTNVVTLVQNGSDKIGGSTINGTLDVEGIAVTLVFIDSTQGWLVTDSGLQSEAPTATYIVATGGTPTTSPCGNFKIHTFTGPGTFCVSNAGNAGGSNTVDYLVVAGAGGGGGSAGGGGGAGGFRLGSCESPKPALASTALSVSAQGYPITVGAGGPGGPANPPQRASSGNNSIFSTITSTAGGYGAKGQEAGGSGGSGGGGGNTNPSPGGTGNTPPVSPAQGSNGGSGSPGCSGSRPAGGGGGASAVGTNGPPDGSAPNSGGPGGAGSPVTDIFGASPQPFYPVPGPGEGSFSGGGGGGVARGSPTYNPNSASTGGVGGGSAGGAGQENGTAGITNSGGGGGAGGGGLSGGCCQANGAAGGSGIVIIRYKFQN
jgi:hypothetical protein